MRLASETGIDPSRETSVFIKNGLTELRERLEEVGLLQQPVGASAFAELEQAAVTEGAATTALTVEECARRFFLTLTHSDTYASMLARRLAHYEDGDIPYIFGQEGVVVSHVGRGQFGIVYLVYFYGLQHACAVKVSKFRSPDVYPEHSESRRVSERFARDTHMTARHRGRKVLPDFEKHGTVSLSPSNGEMHPYYAMEYLHGRSLKDVLDDVEKTGRTISPQAAFNLLHALLLKISRFEGVHRDIKPDNVQLLDDGMTIRLMDPGLAVDPTENARLTKSDDGGLGTPYYMAPIQFYAPALANKLDDLYSSAALVHHLLTGKPPVEGRLMLISRKHEDALRREGTPGFDLRDAQQGIQLPNDVPQPLATALRAMLRKSRKFRALTPRTEDPQGSEVTDILGEWQAHLAEYVSFPDREDPSIINPQRLPDQAEVGGDIIGSRYTREQIFALMTVGGERVLACGELTGPQGRRQPWKMIAWSGAAVLVVGGVVIGTVAFLKGGKEVDGKSTPSVPAIVDKQPKPPETLLNLSKPYPKSETVNRVAANGFSTVSIGADDRDMTMFILKHPDNAAALSGEKGVLCGFRIGWRTGALYITGLDQQFSGGGYSFKRKGGSAFRTTIDAGTVALLRKQMGATGEQQTQGSSLNMVTFGDREQWVLLYIDGEKESVLANIGREAGDSTTPRPMVFPSGEDCRRYLDQQGFRTGEFTVAYGPADETKARLEGRDEFGRALLPESDSVARLRELHVSLRGYLGPGADLNLTQKSEP